MIEEKKGNNWMDSLSKPRLNGLQALRSLAFLGIFISHTGLGPLAALGAWGVSIFILMSGFLMTYNHYGQKQNETGPHCAWRHIRKLYPLHIIMMFLSAAMVAYGIVKHHGSFAELLRVIALNAALLQAWIPNSDYYFSLNSVAWYLSVCVTLYFVYPLILRAIRSYRGKRTAWIAIALTFTLQVFFSLFAKRFGAQKASDWFSVHWMTYIFPVYRIGDFVIGCNLGYLFLNRRGEKNLILSSFGELLAFAVIALEWYLFATGSSFWGDEHIKYTLLFLPANVALIWLFAWQTGRFSKMLNKEWVVQFGELTAYAFLIHLFLIRIVGGVVRKFLSFEGMQYLIAVLAFVVTIFCAAVYKKWIAPMFFTRTKGA